MQENFPSFIRTNRCPKGKSLDNRTKVLFHHLPKTAGSTFRGFLESLFEEADICRAEINSELWEIEDLNQYKFFAGHFSFGTVNKYLGDAIWLTFLRNPVERVISHFYNHRDISRVPEEWRRRVESTMGWAEYVEKSQGLTLNEWIALDDENANRISCNRQTQGFISDKTRKAVLDWSLYDSKIVDEAKANLNDKFDFIGLQEFFDLSMDVFSMTFGRYALGGAERFSTNINKEKSFSQKYEVSNELKNIIAERNAMDIELYEYAKQVFFKRLAAFNENYLYNDRLSRLSSFNVSDNKQKIDHDVESLNYFQGLYALEGATGNYFRWLGAESPAILELRQSLLPEKKYEICLNFVNFLDKKIFDELKIFLCGIELENLRIKTNFFNGGNIRGEFVSSKNGFDLSVQVIKIFCKTAIEPTDMPGARQLSFALSSLTIREI